VRVSLGVHGSSSRRGAGAGDAAVGKSLFSFDGGVGRATYRLVLLAVLSLDAGAVRPLGGG
jgi:hypothetical protein